MILCRTGTIRMCECGCELYVFGLPSGSLALRSIIFFMIQNAFGNQHMCNEERSYQPHAHEQHTKIKCENISECLCIRLRFVFFLFHRHQRIVFCIWCILWKPILNPETNETYSTIHVRKDIERKIEEKNLNEYRIVREWRRYPLLHVWVRKREREWFGFFFVVAVCRCWC